MGREFVIRSAILEDLPAILEIYNYYVRETTISFLEEELTIDEMEEKYHQVTQNYPFLVLATQDGDVVGYAYADRFRAYPAYRLAETTVYLSPNEQGKKLAKPLYVELLVRLAEQGDVSNVIAAITMTNKGSIKFHEKLGFKFVGSWTKAGYKFEEWLDVGTWELVLPEEV